MFLAFIGAPLSECTTVQMAWVGAMNSTRNRAAEILKSELICVSAKLKM